MNGKPQAVQGNKQEDLLEQIITQELEKMKAPAQAAAGSTPADGTCPAPRRENSGQTASPADRKHRRSAVYLYLLILLGAALLMLLLAYFVQRRNSENTISDLHNSMNLSRAGLLAEILELEDRNAALEEANAALEEGNAGLISTIYSLNDELVQLHTLYTEKDVESRDLWYQVYADQEALYSWASFWELERCYQAGDLQSCAAVLILQGQGEFPYNTPVGTEARQAEIVRAVIDTGILDENRHPYPGRYTDTDLLDAYFSNAANGRTERIQ